MLLRSTSLLALTLLTVTAFTFIKADSPYSSYPSNLAPAGTSSNNYVRQKRNVLQNLAVDRLLRDRGFVMSLINCVLDKGPCDGHGRHLKRMAPEILRGHCPGCDRASKTNMRRLISHVQRNFPQEWSEVMNRFLRYPSQQIQQVFG